MEIKVGDYFIINKISADAVDIWTFPPNNVDFTFSFGIFAESYERSRSKKHKKGTILKIHSKNSYGVYFCSFPKTPFIGIAPFQDADFFEEQCTKIPNGKSALSRAIYL
jgi:hypothetical protein